MKKSILKVITIFLLFFIGTCAVVSVDTVCAGYTGYGGKLVFDVEKIDVFH